MTTNYSTLNEALVRFLLLPTLFLSVALLGGLRVGEGDHAFLFVAPPLITLILAVMLMALFVRGGLIRVDQWLRSDQPALTNVAHALTLMALFFAAAQAFNSVLPERGLLFWLFVFFFLWTLWNNLFTPFDARQLVRSLAAMFGMAFVMKHILVAALTAPEGTFLQKLTGVLLEGLSLGTLNLQPYAPATGYISFFTLSLFVVGLVLLPRAPSEPSAIEVRPALPAGSASAPSRIDQANERDALPPVIIVELEEETTIAEARDRLDDEETVVEKRSYLVDLSRESDD
jgi:hypothetical protein